MVDPSLSLSLSFFLSPPTSSCDSVRLCLTLSVFVSISHPLISVSLSFKVLNNDGKLRFYDVLSSELEHPGLEVIVGPDRSKVFIGLDSGTREKERVCVCMCVRVCVCMCVK